ncbi:MAG: DUF1847 domain-containing protein [Deltaproteobacteria bacterium]|nr:DUF1847 domain-containing protein [Deltaproteobacteria bacterium]
MENTYPQCARCPYAPQDRICLNEDGKAPPFCPTTNHPEVFQAAAREFDKPDIRNFAKQASLQEADGYADRELGYARTRPLKPRILETAEFADKMGYKKLGLVFCIGLAAEARKVDRFFSSRGFEVVSGICKAGRVSKEVLDIGFDQNIRIGSFESMCNPIAQAKLLNLVKTEFNIMMGLCVGHDSLFLKYAEAPCTVLAVKDRLLGHNPLAAVYTLDSYYRVLKVPKS